jgi:hypothetical protein
MLGFALKRYIRRFQYKKKSKRIKAEITDGTYPRWPITIEEAAVIAILASKK